MRIGFDLDRIFINTPPLVPAKLVEFLYGRKVNNLLTYRIPSKKEQVIRKITHISILRPPIRKNLRFLQSLSSYDHTLYLISSRYSFLKDVTAIIVKKHKLDKLFRELYFNYSDRQPHVYKSDLINKLKLDKFIDDDLYLLKYVAGRNNRVKLYWLNNKLDKKISKNIRAITDLSVILKD